METVIAPVPLSQDEVFVDLVSFKWLMAGLGWRVDLTRMRRDAVYARECAARGLSAPLSSSVLQRRSRDLIDLLGTAA
jgi:hypothetical protein